MQPQPPESTARLSRYLPRPVITWLAEDPDRRHQSVEGTLVFADVSGFTALSERLAKQGRIGAEILAGTISSCFTRLLGAAYANGGSLLKFGGDALLLLFTGQDHCRRACHAAAGMRRELRGLDAIDGAGGRTRLRMSVGVRTGSVDLFLVGEQYLELIVAGPTATEVVTMEAAADKGEILVSPDVVRRLSAACLGASKGPGVLLRREPTAMLTGESVVNVRADVAQLARAVPPWLVESAISGNDDPQHRSVSVSFLKFSGVDQMLREVGPSVTAEALHELVTDVQTAAEQNDVFLLGSDVDKDGGKLLIVGGAPLATGNDEQAILCAVRQVIERERPLTIRIGVNTGPAFAGDVGPAYRRTFTTMGDTVNVAARIMAHAQPGTVLARAHTLERCRTTFAVTPVPPFKVKGKKLPVEAVEVGAVRESAGPALADLRPMIGRDDELALLRRAWTDAVEGRGRAVVLVGEPGIGKSKLLTAATQLSNVEPVTVACDQYDASTPYAAARQLLRRALGCPANATETAVKRRLGEVLADAPDELRRFAPLLGMVLRVALPMTPEVTDLDERFRRPRLEQTTIDLLHVLRPEPCLVTIEDAHWMDEASASLFDRLLAELPRRPWLLSVTRRPVSKGWQPTGTNADVVELAPLQPNAAMALTEVLLPEGTALEPDLVADVVARAGGNPLFLTELVAGLNASGTANLPDSLEGLILARIDSLPPGDAVLLRRLSVLGAAFPLELARAVLGRDVVPSRADPTWQRIAEFVDVAGGRQVGFKHALLLDGAYNSLPFRLREDLHAKVGEHLERDRASADEHAETLSLHFYQARRFEKAWHYSKLAADRARSVYAHSDAASFYERAIDAGRHGDCAELAELCTLYEEMGDCYRRMGNLARADAAYRSARRLGLDDPVAVSQLLVKQAGVRQQEGSFGQALRWLRRADQLLVESRGKAVHRQRGRIAVSRASVFKDQDRPRELAKWCRAALDAAARAGDKQTQAHAAFLLDHAYVRLGHPELAQNSELALSLYEELGDLWGQGTVVNNAGIYAYWAGRWDEAVDLYERGREIFERIGDVSSTAMAMANVGEIRSDQGRIDEAAELYDGALRIWQRMGDRASVAFITSNLGRLATRSEMFEEATQLLTTARELAMSLGLQADVLDADLRLVECRCHSGDVDGALTLSKEVGQRVPAHSLQAAMFERLVGYSLLQHGDLSEARARLEVSLLEARAAEVPYEEGLTLRALAYLDSAVGVDPMPHLTQAEAILSRLGVVAIDEPVNVSLERPAAEIPAQPTAGSTDTVAS